jgi:hypothetical protein
MPETPSLPLSLRIIAWLAILSGVSALISSAMVLFHGSIAFDVAILELPAGIGMLRLLREARTLQLSLNWLALGTLCFVFVFRLIASESVTFSPGGKVESETQHAVVNLVLIAVASFIAWEHHVLTSERVRELFKPSRRRPSASESFRR